MCLFIYFIHTLMWFYVGMGKCVFLQHTFWEGDKNQCKKLELFINIDIDIDSTQSKQNGGIDVVDKVAIVVTFLKDHALELQISKKRMSQNGGKLDLG